MSIKRHHGSHPPSGVRPNAAVNTNPGSYRPPEKKAINVNPSLPGPVGVDAANARQWNMDPRNKKDGGDDCEDRAPMPDVLIS